MSDIVVINSSEIPIKSILWTPMPFVTILFPFTGYCCLSNSKGVIYTFSSTGKIRKTVNGSYLGKIVLSNKLKIDNMDDELWDSILEEMAILYARYEVRYTFWVHNCFSFVSEVLATFEDEKLNLNDNPRYFLLRTNLVKKKPQAYHNVIKSFYTRPKSAFELIFRYIFTSSFVSLSSGITWWVTPLLIWGSLVAVIVICILCLVK